MPPLAKQGVVEGPTSSAIQEIVTLTKGICVVNGVLYFKMSYAIEHVLAIKETSVMTTGVKLPEPTTESAKITGVYI